MNAARFFAEASRARMLVDIQKRLGWWNTKPRTDAESDAILAEYEHERIAQ